MELLLSCKGFFLYLKSVLPTCARNLQDLIAYKHEIGNTLRGLHFRKQGLPKTIFHSSFCLFTSPSFRKIYLLSNNVVYILARCQNILPLLYLSDSHSLINQ